MEEEEDQSPVRSACKRDHSGAPQRAPGSTAPGSNRRSPSPPRGPLPLLARASGRYSEIDNVVIGKPNGDIFVLEVDELFSDPASTQPRFCLNVGGRVRSLIAAGGDGIEIACGLQDASVALVQLGASPKVIQVIGHQQGDMPGPVTKLAWLSGRQLACYTPGDQEIKRVPVVDGTGPEIREVEVRARENRRFTVFIRLFPCNFENVEVLQFLLCK
jgi:hypothetical protein